MTLPLVIAEVGNNHEGDINAALEMLERAKEAGADLVKFQAGTAEGFARSQLDVQRYRKYELGREGYERLLERGRLLGIPVFFSVWSEEFADLRDKPGWYKLAARQYNVEEVKAHARDSHTFVSIPHNFELARVQKIGCGAGIPMHCVSEYPARYGYLLRIPVLRSVLGVGRSGVGYSDHTVGISTCIEAVHLYGATAIEKHFTLRHDFGPLRDHQHSATPLEFAEMVLSVKGARSLEVNAL